MNPAAVIPFIFKTLFVGVVFTIVRSSFAMLLVGLLVGMSIYHYNFPVMTGYYKTAVDKTEESLGIDVNFLHNKAAEECALKMK
ncbi:MAG: hypothetical protein GW898_10530 [Thiomicrospira sp.]|nr:hypothetical protein [Thiomicrospira sp.]NCN66338.1 hypothetical protein [Thiomicrospira sp.]NCO14792.1 hypothetical protein [Thiomicrospira sp.]NCO82388.1 hypothetical protein [Thiomicrospira sp.]OIP95483.1 MAG: hypothetical protein AUK56_05430 [Thiomicrospira sp. CG2_30_44_34]